MSTHEENKYSTPQPSPSVEQKYYVHANDDMLVEAISELNKTSPANGKDKDAVGIGHNSRNRV